MRARPGQWRDCRGGAAVEFALLAPLLIVLVAGTLVYGIYFGLSHCVQQLAGEAARASVPGVTEAERIDLAQAQVARSLASYGLLDPRRLTVKAGSAPADPDLFVVTVSFDASRLALNAFGGLLPSPPSRIDRSAAIRRGGA